MLRNTLFAIYTVLLCTLLPAWAQQPSGYPAQPIRLLLGFAPAGSGDLIGRAIAQEMSTLLGQPVVVENKPGAATNIASEAVARAAPDGYTLLLGGSFSHSVNPALFAKLPFDAAKDFTSLGKVATLPTVFAVPASLPVDSLRGFIDFARKEGTKVNYASSGVGSPGHIAGGYLNKSANLAMTHVPYKGGSEAVRALVAGEVQLIITSPPSVMGLVKQGRVKTLALTSAKASNLLPGIPGAKEAGLDNFDIDGWYGLYGPAGLPEAVASKLSATLNKVLAMPQIKEKFEAQGALVDASASAQEFARFGEQDRTRWAAIVKDSGARVE
jgi:tripartite-type tricarboxylate transporter receptor subunit TctC